MTYLMIDKLHMNDFGKFYYSIVTYLGGGEMYGPNPSTFITVSPLFGQQFWNLNPPHFHLPLLPLGYLSPEVALAIWGSLNLIALIASLRLIGKELDLNPTTWQGRFLFLAFLAFSGTGSFFLTGQLSFLLLYPITLAWIYARHAQWTKTGLSLGLACAIKPFLLIFAPYFLIKKHYSALLNLFLIFAIAYIAGLCTFGPHIYWQWIAKIQLVDWSWASMNASIHGWLSRTLSENPTFAPSWHLPQFITPLWIACSGILGIVLFAILHLDQSPQSVDRAFALLLLGAILISPLGWIYYLFFPLGPLTGMVHKAWSDKKKNKTPRFPVYERTRNILMVLAGAGLIFPLQFAYFFQPNWWATLTIGSMYFWSTLAVWTALLLDWHITKCPNFRYDHASFNEIKTLYGVRPETASASYMRMDREI